MIVLLSACQSVEKNTKLIAGTFNTATTIQMKMLDRFAPPDVIVHNNIPYQANVAKIIGLNQNRFFWLNNLNKGDVILLPNGA